MRSGIASLVAAALLVGYSTGASAADRCTELDWTTYRPLTHNRPLQPRDLVRLRDVGPLADDLPARHVFSLSPDRRMVAFHVRRADPVANRYCLGIVVMPLRAGAHPIFVDRGGALIRRPMDAGVFPMRMTGLPAIITPHWSPDGSWIAFLKRVRGTTQIWRADAQGGGSEALTHFEQDVLDFRIAAPTTIIAKVRSGVRAAKSELAREARTGFHLDARFMPIASSTPTIRLSPRQQFMAIDVVSGYVRPATVSEIALFDPSVVPSSQQRHFADSESDCAVKAEAAGAGVPPRTRLVLRCPGARPITCEDEVCTETSGALWWTRSGEIRFMRREDWAQSRTAVYEWEPAGGEVRKLYSTSAFLIDCQPRDDDQLICLRETSLHPRHLVAIDLIQGVVSTIADFNPEFASLMLGPADRIELRSDAGIEAFADVVLPVGYRRGHRYPLVVVQYQSRGFLRGGTGDEFPIQAYANLGFAVLSIQRPMAVGALWRPNNYVEVDRRSLRDFADWRSVLSVIEQGVSLLIDRGIADPDAIGITGLSGGSSIVQFAALNSDLFSAAIVSGCCWEPGQTAILGPAAGDLYARIGWPSVTERAESFWSRISLARNAKRVAFPILFDAADDEFRAALKSYTALREAGKATDFFVFPNEHHIKWQPAHRLAAYERSINWFRYWLRGIWPSNPAERAETERWAAMDPHPRKEGQ